MVDLALVCFLLVEPTVLALVCFPLVASAPELTLRSMGGDGGPDVLHGLQVIILLFALASAPTLHCTNGAAPEPVRHRKNGDDRPAVLHVLQVIVVLGLVCFLLVASAVLVLGASWRSPPPGDRRLGFGAGAQLRPAGGFAGATTAEQAAPPQAAPPPAGLRQPENGWVDPPEVVQEPGREGRAAQHPAAADVPHRLETDGLDAAAGAQLRPAGGFAGATTAEQTAPPQAARHPADDAGLARMGGTPPLEAVSQDCHAQAGRLLRPAAANLHADREVTLAAASPESRRRPGAAEWRADQEASSQQPARMTAPSGRQPNATRRPAKSPTRRPARTRPPCGLRPSTLRLSALAAPRVPRTPGPFGAFSGSGADVNGQRRPCRVLREIVAVRHAWSCGGRAPSRPRGHRPRGRTRPLPPASAPRRGRAARPDHQTEPRLHNRSPGTTPQRRWLRRSNLPGAVTLAPPASASIDHARSTPGPQPKPTPTTV